MTTDKHLDAIVAKCRTNLALAEKRTPGKWSVTDGVVTCGWRCAIASHSSIRFVNEGDDTLATHVLSFWRSPTDRRCDV